MKHSNKTHFGRWSVLSLPIIVLIFTFNAGCGNLTDPDRKVVAEMDGDKIRRADLREMIRESPDDERPLIQNHKDLLKTLNNFIDKEIMSGEAKKLRGEKKIDVEREQARAVYFAKNPEFVNIDTMTNPTAMGITQGELIALQAEMEFGIDDEEDMLYRDAAFQYRVETYVKELLDANKILVTEEELSYAYEVRKDTLTTLEFIDFVGIRFPNAQGARQEATRAKTQIDNGDTFDNVVQSYMNNDARFGFRASFENNPEKPHFQRFWYNVTGCKKGDIIGPVFLPSYEQRGVGADGKEIAQNQPDSWVILEVLEHRGPRPKTLEESQTALVIPILSEKVMLAMREEHGVTIFPDMLWRPEGYGDQFKDSMIRTSEE